MKLFSKKLPPARLEAIIIILLLLIGLVPIYLQQQILIASFEQGQIDSRRSEMNNQYSILASRISRDGYLTDPSTRNALDGQIETLAGIYAGRIMIINKDFRIIKDTFAITTGKYNISPEVLRCISGESTNRYYADSRYIVQTLPIYSAEDSSLIEGVLLAVSSTESIRQDVNAQKHRAEVFILAAAVCILVLGIIFTWILTRPLHQLSKNLQKVAQGDLDIEISSSAYVVTDQISTSVDAAVKRLKALDMSRDDFVANVSHELKTPITSMRVLADSIMSMDDVPPELYKEFMQDISEEVDRQSQIIDDLLTLVRMDKRATPLNIDSVDVNKLIEQVLKRIRPIAVQDGIELILESIRDVKIEGDETKLILAMTNLIENAIKYNNEGGLVRIVVDADHKNSIISIVDTGIGIPQESLEHIFERFYRVDKARSRQRGGTGLGLSITRNIILMHHGTINISSEVGVGSTFTITIPLSYIPES